MKITHSQLTQIIKEEIAKVLAERAEDPILQWGMKNSTLKGTEPVILAYAMHNVLALRIRPGMEGYDIIRDVHDEATELERLDPVARPDSAPDPNYKPHQGSEIYDIVLRTLIGMDRPRGLTWKSPREALDSAVLQVLKSVTSVQRALSESTPIQVGEDSYLVPLYKTEDDKNTRSLSKVTNMNREELEQYNMMSSQTKYSKATSMSARVGG